MTGSEIIVDCVDVRRQRPPRAELVCTVRLVNRGEAAYWALMPDTLAAQTRSPGAAVLSVAVLRFGDGLLLKATADAGWYAVLLGPGAQVAVQNLPFAWWGELPAEAAVEVQLVTGLELDGQPIADRLGIAWPGDSTVMDAAAMADPAAVIAAAGGTPTHPLHITWTTVETLAAGVDLDGVKQ